ncbi:MAG: heavy-metal-associated domain-containing protein [Chloroflexota bacterium]
MDNNCRVDPFHKPASAKQIRAAERALLAIGGMGCASCAMRVRNSLISMEGVYAVDVLLNLALAEVLYDSTRVSADALKDAVRRAGDDGRHEYHAEMITAA